MPASLSRILHHLSQGGWLLVLLVVLAVAIYVNIFRLSLHLRALRIFALPKERWREILRHPGSLTGPLRAPVDYSTSHGNDADSIRQAVEEIRLEHLAVVHRSLPFLFILISAAPLAGLLGTVVGMLTTFRGLGGQTQFTPLEMISSGVSQALVTTQAGLVIAIPAYMAAAFLKKQADQLDANLAQMECAFRAHLLTAGAPELHPASQQP